MVIIGSLIFAIAVIIIAIYTSKKETLVVVEEIVEEKPIKKTKPKKKRKKAMKKSSNVKIILPYDLLNETIFQGYVRWFYYYEDLLLSDTLHSEEFNKIQTRYINMKSNLMIRITDRLDAYLAMKFNGDYDLFFAECKKLNDWLISDDIAHGEPDAWMKIVEYSDNIEMDAIIEDKPVEFIDPKMNYEYRNTLCIAMFNDIGTKFNEEMKKRALKGLSEMGYSNEDGNKIIEMINNGSTVEEAVDHMEREADFRQIFEEKDILNNDPIAETVDVDQLLEEWRLQ